MANKNFKWRNKTHNQSFDQQPEILVNPRDKLTTLEIYFHLQSLANLAKKFRTDQSPKFNPLRLLNKAFKLQLLFRNL